MERLGFSVPALPLSVRDSCELARRAEELGYTDAWSAEAGGTDAFSVAAAVGIVTDELRIGCAIVPVFTRPPALLAMSTLAVAQATGGRFCLGLGASSETIVGSWMGIDYEHPLTRVRETVEIVRAALAGDKVSYEGKTVSVKGFRMEQAVTSGVPIYLAALGPKMLALADEIADGVALFLCAEEGVRIAAKGASGKELVARIMCFVDEPRDDALAMARWLLTPYCVVPGYNRYIASQGFEDEAGSIAKLWREGDRKGASAAVTDRLVDAMVIIGSAQECKERIGSFRDAGLDTPILAFVSTRGPEAIRDALRAMAPS